MFRLSLLLRCEATFQSNALLGRFLSCFQGTPAEVRTSTMGFLRRDVDAAFFSCSFNGVVSCDGRPIEEYFAALSVPFDFEGAVFTPHHKKASGQGFATLHHVRNVRGWEATGRRIVYPFSLAIETTDGMRISHLAFRCRLREVLQAEGKQANTVWM